MRGLILVLLSLGATAAWAETEAPIRIYGGTGFSGWSEILLFPDDAQQVSNFRHSTGITTTRVQLAPGAFADSLSYLRDNPIAEGRLTTKACPDYGTDTVEYNGDPGIAYSVACPDPQLGALTDALKRIIVLHGGRTAP